MSGPGYRTAHLDELERFDGDAVTIPVRIPLGIGSFGINAYAAREAGDQVIEEHDELGAGAGHHEELYFVLKATHVSSSMETSWTGLRAPSSSSPTPPLAVRRRPPRPTPRSSS